MLLRAIFTAKPLAISASLCALHHVEFNRGWLGATAILTLIWNIMWSCVRFWTLTKLNSMRYAQLLSLQCHIKRHAQFHFHGIDFFFASFTIHSIYRWSKFDYLSNCKTLTFRQTIRFVCTIRIECTLAVRLELKLCTHCAVPVQIFHLFTLTSFFDETIICHRK